MNKVCLYYGIICGVFLTSTAAPAADCTVGAILYNDGQCHEIPLAGVEPAGVVFDTAKRLAVGLNSKVLPWGGRGIDVAAAVNCSSNKTESCPDGSPAATAAIVAAIGGGDYAAAYCLKQPGGKYFLPGVAQLQLLAARKKEVDAVLAKLRAATGDGRIYWSADENRSTDALAVAMDDGGVYGSYKETLLSVRCVISY